MVTPRNVSYTGAAGSTLYFGRAAPSSGGLHMLAGGAEYPATVLQMPATAPAGWSLLATVSRSVDFYGFAVEHAGAVYIPERKSLWIHGAETHSNTSQFTNSPYHIDLTTMKVYRDRAISPCPGEYRLDADGVPWADAAHTAPWATHGNRQVFKMNQPGKWHFQHPALAEGHAGTVVPQVYEDPARTTENRVIWTYDTATLQWSADGLGSKNAGLNSFCQNNVGYPITYHAGRGSLVSNNAQYLREFNLATGVYSGQLATVLVTFNGYAFERADGKVVFTQGANSSGALYAVADIAANTVVTKSQADFPEMAGLIQNNCPWAQLPDGRLWVALKDQTNNKLKAFIVDTVATTAVAGGEVAVTARVVENNRYMMLCDYATDFGMVVLVVRDSVANLINIYGYKV